MIRTEFNGVKLEGPDTAQGVIDEVCAQDVYRIGEIPLGASVLDIGAHIGTFTCRCIVERKCDVVAYEPNPISMAWLERNIQLNHRLGEFATGIAFSEAVGFPGGDRLFECNLDHPAGSGFKSTNDHGKVVEVPVVCITLPQIIGDVGSTDVLKLDCEGAEAEIFSDPNFDIAIRDVSIVLMEWHSHDGYIYRDALQTLGFKVELTGGSLPNGDLTPYDKSMTGGMLYARRA